MIEKIKIWGAEGRKEGRPEAADGRKCGGAEGAVRERMKQGANGASRFLSGGRGGVRRGTRPTQRAGDFLPSVPAEGGAWQRNSG